MFGRAGARPDQRDLVAVAPTRACGPAARARGESAADAFEQLARARHREARRERGAQPAVGRARATAAPAPTLSSMRRAASFEQPRRRPVGVVHHALADHRAQPGRRQRLEHRIGVVHRLHRQHGGRAAAQQFAAASRAAAPASAGVCAASIGQMRVLSQSSSAQVVGVAAEQRLAQMDVGLDEAGQRGSAAGVDDAIVRRRDRRRPTATIRPSRIEHVALDHVEGVVHGERCVAPRMSQGHAWL